MSEHLHIYHPNKAVKGFACSFWASERHGSLFATILKQSGWNEASQTGSFKESLNDPARRVNVKLSDIEVGAILDCIERNRPFSTFHTSTEAPKTISFIPWMSTPIADEDGNRPAAAIKGYSFTINVGAKTDPNKASFYIGLTFAEARLIREYLVHYLHKTFNAKSQYPRGRDEDDLPKDVVGEVPVTEEVNNSPSQPSDVLGDF